MATIRDGVEDLDARTKVIRPRIERAPPKARFASEKAMSVVERDRTSLATRLAIIELLGGAFDEDGPAMREMERMMKQATWVLSAVESWYGLH